MPSQRDIGHVLIAQVEHLTGRIHLSCACLPSHHGHRLPFAENVNHRDMVSLFNDHKAEMLAVPGRPLSARVRPRAGTK